MLSNYNEILKNLERLFQKNPVQTQEESLSILFQKNIQNADLKEIEKLSLKQ